MKKLLVAAALLLGMFGGAHAQGATVVTTCGTLPLAYAPGSTRNLTVDINGNNCSSASASITFPTIGAAVPVTGIYNGINVAGTLRGVTGLALGSTYSQTMAIVDASGNQITSFGGSGAVTIIDGGNVVEGATADAAATAGSTGTLSAKLRLMTTQLGTIGTNTTGAATAANQTTANSSLATIATNTGAAVPAGNAIIGKVGIDQTTPGTTNGVQVNAALPAGTNTIGTVGQLPYPVGATAIVASTTGTTGATTATLAGTSSKTTYICSYSVRANATGAATVNNTIAPIASGLTMTHVMWVAPLASGIGIDEQIFMPCLPASATNTSILVIGGAPGSGGAITVTAAGYQL